MKKIALFYSITLIVGTVLILGINEWITAAQSRGVTQQTQTHPETPLAADTPDATTAQGTNADTPGTVKKKTCACCADRMARIAEHIRKARERKRQREQE